jgi:putative acetyltransferase
VQTEEAGVIVRPETERDVEGIRAVNIVAFEGHAYSQQTEHLIVEALREADALEVSLVAEIDGEVAGHIAFSAATIGDSSMGWFLLGPVAVRPERQGEGIGRALVEAGLEALRARGACGCVLVGDPAFYGRFGFLPSTGVVWHGVPDENVLCLRLSGEMPTGEVAFHPAFLVGT